MFIHCVRDIYILAVIVDVTTFGTQINTNIGIVSEFLIHIPKMFDLVVNNVVIRVYTAYFY